MISISPVVFMLIGNACLVVASRLHVVAEPDAIATVMGLSYILAGAHAGAISAIMPSKHAARSRAIRGVLVATYTIACFTWVMMMGLAISFWRDDIANWIVLNGSVTPQPSGDEGDAQNLSSCQVVSLVVTLQVVFIILSGYGILMWRKALAGK